MADEDRIARVARALCVADGSDPEAMIEVGMDLVEEAGASAITTSWRLHGRGPREPSPPLRLV